MKKRILSLKPNLRIILFLLLGFLFLFILWQILSLTINAYIIPSPIKVIPAYISSFAFIATYEAILATITRLVISVLFACILGLILGLISGSYADFHRFLMPFISALRSVPTAVIILISISIIKISFSPIIVSFLITFPLIYEATYSGVKSIDRDLYDAMRLEGEYHWQTLLRVKLPIAMPYVLLSIIQAVGLGMKVTIMSEVLSGNNRSSGLGFSIAQAYYDADFIKIFVFALHAIVISIIFDLVATNFRKKSQFK